jgi:hypothetical protein
MTPEEQTWLNSQEMEPVEESLLQVLSKLKRETGYEILMTMDYEHRQFLLESDREIVERVRELLEQHVPVGFSFSVKPMQRVPFFPE